MTQASAVNPEELTSKATQHSGQQLFESEADSQARFRAIFDSAAVGIGIMGLDRKVIDANTALCRMYGRSLEELVGQTSLLVVHPDEAALAMQKIDELVSGQQGHYSTERRYIRKNGEVFWAHITLSLVRDSSGAPRYLVGMVVDIDAQKRSQEELRQSETRFRVMFDNASVGMALIGLDRRVVAINQAAERITGYTTDELAQMDLSDLTYPEDREIGMDAYRQMIAGQRPGFQMEKRYLHKDGHVYWARVNYSCVPDGSGRPQYLVGMIEDIDQQRRATEQLAEQEAEYLRRLEQHVDERTRELAAANLRLLEEINQRQRAEQALAAKAAEEAVVAERTRLARELHDAVTQTLFSASLMAEVLPEMWQLDPFEAQKSTEELRQLTRGALAEMRTLLLELRPATLTQTRFGDLLRQLCEALIGRGRLPIDLTIEGERGLPPDVQVALYRIAQESLNNVFKYARASQVNVSLFLTPAGAHLEIADNGVGFDRRAVKPGSLGMRIMNERAETIGAKLHVSSTPGKGTIIAVTWTDPSQGES